MITVCDNAQQNCPIFPGAGSRIHWSIADPAGIGGTEQIKLAAFRAARDDLQERLSEFIETVKEGVAKL